MRPSSSLLPLLAITIFAAPLAAQRAAGRTSSVHGWVKDARGTPIENAEVLVMGTKLAARTNDQGAFRIDSVPAGQYWLGARRLGFEPVTFTATFKANDSREFDVQLDPLPHDLPEVKIKEKSDFSSRRLREFDWRRRSAWGWFYTRDDLQRQSGWSISSLLVRHFPGLSSYQLDWPDDRQDGCGRSSRFAGGGFGCGNSFGLAHCAPAVSLNGSLPMAGWGLSSYSADNLEAVEVYRGRDLEIPFELQNSTSRRCGVVVLWTK